MTINFSFDRWFYCLILPQFLAFSSFFQLFDLKKCWKIDFDQHLEHAALKQLWKYTTLSDAVDSMIKPYIKVKVWANIQFFVALSFPTFFYLLVELCKPLKACLEVKLFYKKSLIFFFLSRLSRCISSRGSCS